MKLLENFFRFLRSTILHYNEPDKAEKVETVGTHLQNGKSATGEDSDVGNGGRRSASWKTVKKLV